MRDGYVRVIDESGDDYLYPAEYFVPVRVPVARVGELVWREVSEPVVKRARRG